MRKISRRDLFIGLGGASAAGLAVGIPWLRSGLAPAYAHDPSSPVSAPHGRHPAPAGSALNGGHGHGFDPMAFLESFDLGQLRQTPDGKSVREFFIRSVDTELEVAPGVVIPIWAFNETVPGPTLRCTEGELVRVRYENESRMPHTIHFHGIHPAKMDGALEIIPPGDGYTYEFIAEPFGLFLYHCHVMPLKQHIHRGLYGTFIVDPAGGRPPARELVMVMNGFDTDLDGENEFYAVNSLANFYHDNPIEIRLGELVRIYLVNLTEFDLINSFHLHGNVFKLYRTGTRLDHYEITDTVMLCQGERAILEFSYKYPGLYMFHAHQSEFAELGWTGFFKVV
jgi:FtsP/CotA-like multicopper oxidase with cupredoxin domain